MPLLTLQETFTTIADHLLSQRRRSTRAGACMYRASGRADDPVRCAVGCLIPDDRYTPTFEGSAWSMIGHALRRVNLIAPDMGTLLNRAQELHDWTPVQHWPAALYDLACDLKVAVPPSLAAALISWTPASDPAVEEGQ
jgi:hypothetical protein